MEPEIRDWRLRLLRVAMWTCIAIDLANVVVNLALDRGATAAWLTLPAIGLLSWAVVFELWLRPTLDARRRAALAELRTAEASLAAMHGVVPFAIAIERRHTGERMN